MIRRTAYVSTVLLLLVAMALPAHAQLPGAIFTTLPDGSAVNFNIYPSKDLVYLDGGPGPGAPATAAGLPDGIYVFQVTDPPGKTLLSTDRAGCRQFSVSGGLITGVIAFGGCEHPTGTDLDHNAKTVKLMPFDDTPNNGDEYKAWATPVGAFLAGCSALGEPNGLDVVDCGYKPGVAVHGFIPAWSKTDNFKTRGANREVDTYFISNATGARIDGLNSLWVDTLGASNPRWSYSDASINLLHGAHVENVEDGTHHFVIANQAGCQVTSIGLVNPDASSRFLGTGPQTITLRIKPTFTSGSYTFFVYCN